MPTMLLGSRYDGTFSYSVCRLSIISQYYVHHAKWYTSKWWVNNKWTVDDYLAGRVISYTLYIRTMAKDISFKCQLLKRNWAQAIIGLT